jgi:MFS family permease
VAVLLIQFSANISHGPLQGLIPDMVPEDQRGQASAVKAIFELAPIILVGLTIAPLLGGKHLGWAIIATGAGLFITAVVTIFTVKEKPLIEKPDIPFWPPMLRVLGMLAGIIIGALAGLLGGELVGGSVGLVTWLIAGKETALVFGVGIGGVISMVIAVVTGVWAGSIATLSKGTGIILGTFIGLLCGGLLGGIAYIVALPLAGTVTAAIIAINIGGIIAMVLAAMIGVRANRVTHVGQEARQNSSFIWWIVNRLLFLAAMTSLQGFALYFIMYAFKVTPEQSADMTGTLTFTIGIFILVSAVLAGWLADRIGHKRLVGLSGILAAVGGSVLLGTIWLPNLSLIYLAGFILGLATGLFMTANWAMGTNLVPPEEAGRYLGISNLAGAGAGMIGAGIGGPVADYLNIRSPGLGYFAIFAAYVVLFALSTVSLRFIRERKQASPVNI